MSEETPEQCPYCGSKAEVQESNFSGISPDGYIVVCTNESCSELETPPVIPDKNRAVHLWNSFCEEQE